MQDLEIIPYSSALQPHFESINKAWVTKYFSLEPFDIDQLEHPEETILAQGGEIIFAKVGEEILGTVALIPKESGDWEMIKMGVKESAQGKGIGMALGKSLLDLAKEKGAKRVVLYSNTKLEAALRVYEKLGFTPCHPECGTYGRCNVKMEFVF
ncbi:MAG: GNAT family N-acetyltransferase [Algoriphagus sp.]|jgi:GNAT superfamily N-acetyltransferase|nr:GNAT family N-acetyltransferase [Algoriphagus sp.]